MFGDRPKFAVKTNHLDSPDIMDKQTYKTFMSRTDGPFRIINAEHCTPTIVENGVPNTIAIDKATHATTSSMNARNGKGQSVNKEREQPSARNIKRLKARSQRATV